MQDSTIDAVLPHRFEPVGRCIYCGANDMPLTDEHIVPFGLGGKLILPQASCDPCAKITSLIERKVLRGFLDHGRQAFGVKGRKKHKRDQPTVLAQTFLGPNGTTFEQDVPIEQAARVMTFPLLPYPRFLFPLSRPTKETGMGVYGIDTIHFGLGEAFATRPPSAEGVKIRDRIDVISFGRLLAKIAHGYYAALNGVADSLQSPLIPIILGKRSDFRNWIGGMEENHLGVKAPIRHILDSTTYEDDDGSEGIAVRVKLFCPSGPTYILAAKRPSP